MLYDIVGILDIAVLTILGLALLTSEKALKINPNIPVKPTKHLKKVILYSV